MRRVEHFQNFHPFPKLDFACLERNPGIVKVFPSTPQINQMRVQYLCHEILKIFPSFD